MKISVIVPAHNEEDVIEDCLNALLSEDFEPKEIIVVNDGSTDRTREIVESYGDKVKLINFSVGHSAAFARNRGAELATGNILAFVDADQIIGNGFLHRIEMGFKEYKIDMMGVNIETKEKSGLMARCYAMQRLQFSDKMNKTKRVIHTMSNNLPSGAFIFDKLLFHKIKGYDERIFYFEDLDIIRRAFATGSVMLFDPEVKAYHFEPSTFKETFRQGMYKGKGVLSLYNLGESNVFNILINFFYVGLIISVLLLPFIWFLCIPFLAYLIYCFIFEYKYSKDPILAFAMTFIWRPVQGLGTSYGIFKNLNMIFSR